MIRLLFSLVLFLTFTPLIGENHPFNYDLHLTNLESAGPRTVVCFHGMSGDYKIAHYIKASTQTEDHLISFNFPDHGFKQETGDASQTVFGTIQEILPAIYVLKNCIIDEGREEVSLYGFSAGGGAVINTLAVLNSSLYDPHLKKIGVTPDDRRHILKVLQKGQIILDTPLKSVREIIAYRGLSADLELVEQRYRANKMEPIDALKNLDNLSLNIVVHFQAVDEVLSNRDDKLFIERLEMYNRKGETRVILGYDKGHSIPHPTLWNIVFKKDSSPY